MSLIRIDRNPPPRQLAVFGITWLVFFGAVGGIVLSRGGPPAVTDAIWAAALLVPAIGWMAPRFMRVVYVGMAYLAFPIGFVLSHLLLAAVYYLVLTPIGLLMRVVGYDPLNRRFDAGAESYWSPRDSQENVSRYFRQT